MSLSPRVQNDTVEKCRELSIELLTTAAEKLMDPSPLLAQVLPAMAARIGNIPIVETSEEIRLQLVKLLGGALMKRCQASSLNLVMKEILAVLVHSCNDAFHEIVKSTSATVVVLTQAVPKDMLDEHTTGALLKALVPNLSHRHSAVRIAVLKAVDAAVMVGTSDAVMLDTVRSPETSS
eukprot:9150315-Pyramimonas_sp.AAC.1